MYYGEWIKQSEDKYLPAWLKDNLKEVCDCGCEMENYYNPEGRITKRRCSSPVCQFKVALKIVGMCNILQLKGIGEATARKIVANNHITNHYVALKYISQEKPSVNLYTFLRMAFIEGIDTSWSEVTSKYDNLDDVFANYNGQYRKVLEENKDMLYEGLQYVDLIQSWKPKFDAVLEGTVMISGNLHGWNNRNDFIAALNYASEGLVRIGVSEGKRKTGVLALIQEADTPNRGKAECALANGIPIMTPDAFNTWVTNIVKERMSNN